MKITSFIDKLSFLSVLTVMLIPSWGIAQTAVVSPMPQPDANFGSALLGLGDSNGNSTGEYLVAAPYDSLDYYDTAGRVYHIDGLNQDTLRTLTSPNPDYYSNFGSSIARVGDLNGNGVADIAISAPGEQAGSNQNQIGVVYLYDGNTYSSIMKVKPPADGETSGFGSVVSKINDINNDGTHDFLVADEIYIPDDYLSKYVIYIYSGNDTDGDGFADFLHKVKEPVNAEYPYYGTGGEIASGPDFTGDGAGDILIGSRENEHVYLVSGATGEISNIIVTPFVGGSIHEFNGYFGSSVSVIADVNNDTVPEFLVGAPSEYGDRQGGKAYVYNGINQEILFEYYSPISGNPSEFGYSAASVSDVNGDGRSDFAIASKANAPDGTWSAGRVYVYSTSDGSFITELVSSFPQDPGTYYDNFGVEITGLPDVNSGGRDEILVAAPFDSMQSGITGAGRVYQYSSQGFPQFNLPPAVNLSANTTRIMQGGTISFTGQASDQDGSIIRYEWDFQNDGTVESTAPNPSHTFYSAGKYAVTLTAMDDDSVSRSATLLVTVLPVKDTGPTRLTDNSVDDTNPFIIGPTMVYYHSDAENGIIRDYTTDYSIQSGARNLNSDQQNVLYVATTINGNSGVYLYTGRITPDETGVVYRNPSRGGTSPFNEHLGSQGLIAYMRSTGSTQHLLAAHDGNRQYNSLANVYDVQLPRVSVDGYTIAYAAKQDEYGDNYSIYRYTWSDSVNDGTSEKIGTADSNENLGSAGTVNPLGISMSDSGEVIAWQKKSTTGDYRQVEYWKNGITYKITGKGWPVVSHDGRYILTHDYLYDTQQELGLDFGDAEHGDMAASLNYRHTFDMDYDANYIVFTGQLDKKLYIHNRTANKTTLVHESNDDIRTPRISPDGLNIVWEEKVNGQDWEIFTTDNPASEGGFDTTGTNISQLPLTQESGLTLSADGRYSAFHGGVGSEIYLYDKRTGIRRAITQNAAMEYNLQLATESAIMVWARSEENDYYDVETVLYDIQTGQSRVVADLARPEFISDDGSRILLSFSGDAKMFRGKDVIYNRVANAFDVVYDGRTPEAYSHDLQRFLYEENDSLIVYDRRDTSTTLIKKSEKLGDKFLTDSAGTKVLYQLQDVNNMEKLIIYHTDADSEQVVNENTYTDDERIYKFAITDDGNTVFYSMMDYNNVADKMAWFKYDVQTGQTVLIDDEGIDYAYLSHDFSTDGRFFTYTKVIQEDPLLTDIYYYDHQSGNSSALTEDKANDYEPVLSDNGTTLIWRGKTGAGPKADSEVWQSQLYEPTVSAGENKPKVPGRFKLYANYPNPFNPATTFRFAVPENARVNIQVFNIRGQRVKTLEMGQVSAGIREVRFDGSNLASGVYLYRVVAKSADRTIRRSGKFTLLK